MRNNKPKTNYKAYTSTTGTKTGVVSNSKGTKTTVVKSAAGGKKVRVTDASGKLLGYNEFDSSGKEIKKPAAQNVQMATPKVTPKVTAEQMDKVPFKNNAIAKLSDKFTGTAGKSYLVMGGKRGKTELFGTREQQDSTYAADNLWNDIRRTNKGNIGGQLTRQAYERDSAKYNRIGFTPKLVAKLPEFVPPGNTGAGSLQKTISDRKANAYGGCSPGYKLDAKGNCVRIKGYVPPQ